MIFLLSLYSQYINNIANIRKVSETCKKNREKLAFHAKNNEKRVFRRYNKKCSSG